jgi:DNA-binding transcriptional LysR family regulator
MKHLRGIETFVKAVETGSIAAAARQLGVTAAAASQAIARLEASLGVQLLTRTTRSLAPTDAGHVYFERVRDLTQQLDSAHSALDELRGEPQGPLRVACTAAVGRHVVAPLLPEFIAAHPRVSVDLVLTDHDIDHVVQGVDLSIRFREQLDPGLVARKLCDMPMVFCASPAYLSRAGRPREPEELAAHDCLVFRVPRDGLVLRWAFVREGVRFEPRGGLARRRRTPAARHARWTLAREKAAPAPRRGSACWPRSCPGG